MSWKKVEPAPPPSDDPAVKSWMESRRRCREAAGTSRWYREVMDERVAWGKLLRRIASGASAIPKVGRSEARMWRAFPDETDIPLGELSEFKARVEFNALGEADQMECLV